MYVLVKVCISFHLFYYLWGKRNVLVFRTRRVKDLLVRIKFLRVLDNRTEVFVAPCRRLRMGSWPITTINATSL